MAGVRVLSFCQGSFVWQRVDLYAAVDVSKWESCNGWRRIMLTQWPYKSACSVVSSEIIGLLEYIGLHQQLCHRYHRAIGIEIIINTVDFIDPQAECM